MSSLTAAQFLNITRAALEAVSDVEMWDAEHPSWVFVDGEARPSRALKAAMRKELKKRGFRVEAESRQKRLAEIFSSE